MPNPTRIVRELPSMKPFIGPEALERELGRPFRLRLGANESPFGMSPLALQAMQAAAAQANLYADPESHALREALAEFHGLDPEEIVVGCGIDDLLALTARMFLEPGEVAVTSLGGYPTFNYVVAGVGGLLSPVPYRQDRNDLEGLAEAAKASHAKLVFLANPDNPTGSFHGSEAILELIRNLPESCVLILDEAYAEFAPGDLLRLKPLNPHVLRMRTFSKIHGMAGARIGYAIGPRELISEFEKLRLHFGINRVAQEGAIAALADQEFVRYVVQENARGREDYGKLARELGFTALESHTNFVAIDVGGPERAGEALQALQRMGVFVRMPGAEPLNRCIRVTVGTPEQRVEFGQALRQVAEEQHAAV